MFRCTCRSVRHVLPVVLLLPSGVQDARDVLRARLPLWHRHHGHEDQDEDGLRHLGKITSILIVFKIIESNGEVFYNVCEAHLS